MESYRDGSQLFRNIQQIRTALDLSSEECGEILLLTEAEQARIARGELDLPLDSAFRFSDHFELSLDALNRGTFDIGVLQAYRRRDWTALPERYRLAARGRARSAYPYLEYFTQNFNWQLRDQMLRDLQVKEAAFTDPDRPVNIRFFADLTANLGRLGIGTAHFYAVGRRIESFLRESALGERLATIDNGPELFETYFTELVRSMDQNCDYRITSRLIAPLSSRMRVECRPRAEVVHELGTERLGSAAVCHYKRGVLSVLPRLAGLRDARVRETECIHAGAAKCLFEIEMTT